MAINNLSVVDLKIKDTLNINDQYKLSFVLNNFQIENKQRFYINLLTIYRLLNNFNENFNKVKLYILYPEIKCIELTKENIIQQIKKIKFGTTVLYFNEELLVKYLKQDIIDDYKIIIPDSLLSHKELDDYILDMKFITPSIIISDILNINTKSYELHLEQMSNTIFAFMSDIKKLEVNPEIHKYTLFNTQDKNLELILNNENTVNIYGLYQIQIE